MADTAASIIAQYSAACVHLYYSDAMVAELTKLGPLSSVISTSCTIAVAGEYPIFVLVFSLSGSSDFGSIGVLRICCDFYHGSSALLEEKNYARCGLIFLEPPCHSGDLLVSIRESTLWKHIRPGQFALFYAEALC